MRLQSIFSLIRCIFAPSLFYFALFPRCSLAAPVPHLLAFNLSFFLGVLVSFSVCWLEDEDEEELVLALESSSDIATPPPHTPTWRGDTMGVGNRQ